MNYHDSKKHLIFIFLLIILIATSILALSNEVLGARLTGTIYDLNLEPAKNVLLRINSTPVQRMLVTDGHYKFSLPTGSYRVEASYLDEGTNATTTEELNITQEGDFVFDIFLIPDLKIDNDLLDVPEIPDINGGNEKNDFKGVIERFIIVLLVALSGYFIIKKLLLNKEKSVEEEDDYEVAIIRALELRGGRATQKEIRQELPLSEAKISLILTDMEFKGKIRKIKKGRGNIIILN